MNGKAVSKDISLKNEWESSILNSPENISENYLHGTNLHLKHASEQCSQDHHYCAHWCSHQVRISSSMCPWRQRKWPVQNSFAHRNPWEKIIEKKMVQLREHTNFTTCSARCWRSKAAPRSSARRIRWTSSVFPMVSLSSMLAPARRSGYLDRKN